MIFYFVQRGESLYHIAKRYQTTVHAIVAANQLADPNGIVPGQALKIPRPGEVPVPPPGGIVHLVRPGETIIHLAQKFGTSVPEILQANQVAHPEFILPGQQLVIPEPAGAGDEWPMVGRDAARTSHSPANLTGTPHPGWSYHPEHTIQFLPSPPVIRYDRVYVGLGDGAYYGFDRFRGRLCWRYPVVGGGQSPPTGEERPGLAAPAVFDGLVYLGTPEGSALALDAQRGTLVWRTGLSSGPVTSAAIADGLAFVGDGGGQLVALELKTGALVWQRSLGAPLVGPPAAGDGLVFARDQQGGLWALDGQTGAVLWQVQDPGTAQPPVFAELLLLAGGRAYDPRSGQLLWCVPEEAAPAVGGETLHYPGGEVDLFSGAYRWRRSPGPEESATGLIVAGGHTLTLTREGALACYRLAGRERLWRLEPEAPIVAPPAVAPGLLALSLANGALMSWCIRPEQRGRRGQPPERE